MRTRTRNAQIWAWVGVMEILVVDDHSLVRAALRPILTGLQDDVHVAESSTFSGAIETASKIDGLDLIVLDLQLPGMSGVADIEVFRTKFPSTIVVILSGYYVRQDVLKAFQYGATGFIPKSLSTDSLRNAFNMVLSGERYIPSDILVALGDDCGIASSNSKVSVENPLLRLTYRQREVLDLLTEGLSNKSIANKLGIQEVTVKLHLKNIYKLLKVQNRTQAVRTALRLGWSA